MDLLQELELVDSADAGISSASGSDSVSGLDRITYLLGKKICLERPTVPFPGESRYLTPLLVFGNGEPPDELRRSDSSLPRTTGLKPIDEKIVPNRLEITNKIRAALKLLTFREPHILIQFWWPRVLGKHLLLTTVDQPFGLGVADKDLCLYRRDSEQNPFFVDKDDKEENLSSVVRVFRRGLAEWTSDVTNYLSNDFPQQECAIRCNLCGYLALPVFDSTSSLCVGVLEILMASKYPDFAYEVEQVHKALKTENLTSPQLLGYPISNVPNERRQHELDKIFNILKVMCDSHSLPLAQTWSYSPFSSYVSHNKILQSSCSSFNTRCIGKPCMSTTALPFHVRDLGTWHFREACRERHLEKSRGFMGRALLTRGLCFCGDVTKLSEEEYPLVHDARMCGLTSCVAIFLHGLEGNDDYVLEFFLPSEVSDGSYLVNLVQTLKQSIEVPCGFELGDVSSIEFVGPPREVGTLSLNIKPDTIQTFSTTTAKPLTIPIDLSDSESIVANIAKTENLAVGNVKSDSGNVSMQKTSGTLTYNAGEKSKSLKQNRKRQIDSLSLEAVKQHLEKPIGEAAKSLGVSRSTLKRFYWEHGIPSWPVLQDIFSRLSRETFRPSKQLKESNDSTLTLIPSSKPINQNLIRFKKVLFFIRCLTRWTLSTRRPEYTTNIVEKITYSSYPYDSDRQLSDISNMFHGSLKYSVIPSGLETKVTIKARYKADSIKFQLPLSSGLLELENQVAQRFKLKGKSLCIKYVDEDDDMILITCDADLHNLLGSFATSGSNNIVKLIVVGL